MAQLSVAHVSVRSRAGAKGLSAADLPEAEERSPVRRRRVPTVE